MNFSKITAGTMTWGQWGKKLSKQEMIDLMHHCLENNIHTFDHADIYGDYSTEADFGNAFAESGIKRSKIELISKCGIQYIGNSRPDLKVKHYNYTKEYIIWSAENSLKHLKTDYLDLLLLHRPSPLLQPEVVAEAVSTLKKEGKIKSFGVSNFTPSQTDLLNKYVGVEVNQIEFSLTQHTAMHDGTLDHMMLNNIQPMSWSPLGYVFKEDTEQTRRIHKQLGALLDKYNATEDQLLLAWILKHPSNIIPVVGTTTKQRLKDAYAATKINLELEDWFLILVACQGHKVP
ncbi:putative oxidoreductase [Mesoflavibacter sabulilitoris]|uniref:Aldo/keto reductase n=1 Tax=Mesoflavibacter zeaxanthinifaciens subsp. sabulilitoris TaxID=1520893 RepID=A0A2T1NI13_9FLAO|nr:aldo/keto reductase [Mesoflavibacter zeaxanthinifaciens]MBB3124431.1 putative oxidoreductase [Mesoflavibacter zeaxanthinifaciens subsp. sabulilitoris]PSG92472.1 aldo/keto reductase [Mesoflavibacter zeaxanthinifaciens subsp. sabulilitoris]